MSSASFEFQTCQKEQIIEAWTLLTEKWRYRWEVIQPWLKQNRICCLLFWWCMSFWISLVSHIDITWNSNSDAALTLCTRCYKYGLMFGEFEIHVRRVNRDSRGILQKRFTIVACNCRVAQVIRLHYTLMNSLSDLLKQASWEHVIVPLLI